MAPANANLEVNPFMAHTAASNSVSLYLKTTISQLNRKVKSHLWQLTQFSTKWCKSESFVTIDNRSITPNHLVYKVVILFKY